jgi:hypothetical protein
MYRWSWPSYSVIRRAATVSVVAVARVVRLKAKGDPPAQTFADKLAKLSAGFPLKARLQAPELWAGVD